MANLGYVGLGAMGSLMAERLMSKGHKVTGYNRTRSKAEWLVKKGMTLAQIKAAGPTSDYDGRYGATSGFWTTDNFVEAVYQSLSQEKP